LQLDLALQQLLNDSAVSDFEELLFWGRVSGNNGDYFIAIGLTFNEQFEFPSKKFYWCSSVSGMRFQQFPALNQQHLAEYNILANLPFTGNWAEIYKTVENPEEMEELRLKREEKANQEKDPLESSSDEDLESLVVKINLKEIDRLHYHVRAIENDCHIIPKGSMRLNDKHEVQRNEAYLGLS